MKGTECEPLAQTVTVLDPVRDTLAANGAFGRWR